MTPTNADCGCLIEYEGDAYQQAWSIDYCPLHEAALATAAQRDRLLEAAKAILREEGVLRPWYATFRKLEAATLAAQPETQLEHGFCPMSGCDYWISFGGYLKPFIDGWYKHFKYHPGLSSHQRRFQQQQ